MKRSYFVFVKTLLEVANIFILIFCSMSTGTSLKLFGLEDVLTILRANK